MRRLTSRVVPACAVESKLVACRRDIHQDAFAADYQDHEYALLGKAIKFAGLHGKEVRIIGKNRDTLKDRADPN